LSLHKKQINSSRGPANGRAKNRIDSLAFASYFRPHREHGDCHRQNNKMRANVVSPRTEADWVAWLFDRVPSFALEKLKTNIHGSLIKDDVLEDMFQLSMDCNFLKISSKTASIWSSNTICARTCRIHREKIRKVCALEWF
jgi:hypothetical protein